MFQKKLCINILMSNSLSTMQVVRGVIHPMNKFMGSLTDDLYRKLKSRLEKSAFFLVFFTCSELSEHLQLHKFQVGGQT